MTQRGAFATAGVPVSRPHSRSPLALVTRDGVRECSRSDVRTECEPFTESCRGPCSCGCGLRTGLRCKQGHGGRGAHEELGWNAHCTGKPDVTAALPDSPRVHVGGAAGAGRSVPIQLAVAPQLPSNLFR